MIDNYVINLHSPIFPLPSQLQIKELEKKKVETKEEFYDFKSESFVNSF
jgi:hypothetical protein